jgi:hypothetical protein
MPRQNGDRDAITARRADVAKLYCAGWPQHRIAAKFEVTQQQISLDLKAIRREWQRVMAKEFDRLRAEQLAKVDALEAEAYRGWRRSCRDAEQKTTKDVQTDDGLRREESETRKGQSGDAQFLKIVDNCIDRRCKLIGAYAPTKIAPTTPDGQSLPLISVVEFVRAAASGQVNGHAN